MGDTSARRARLVRLLFGGRPTAWGLLVPVVLVLAGLLFATSAVTSRGRSLRPSDTRDLAGVIDAQDASLEAKQRTGVGRPQRAAPGGDGAGREQQTRQDEDDRDEQPPRGGTPPEEEPPEARAASAGVTHGPSSPR